MRLKRTKCVFMAHSVEYLGHRISKEGITPTEDKVRAITEAPEPSNVSELRAFLGLINYYSKFLPNLSTVLAPLYKLLLKTATWKWRSQEREAFQEAKSLLQSPQLLVHYDPRKELILTCDASPVRLGAVLSHRMDGGTERPIAYASRSLTVAERNYAQIDKEALAIVFGVKKYHQYLYGRNFIIYSDHKPLIYLFSEQKAIPATASARVQRWALTLSGYQYTIKHRPGVNQGNADGLSRLPLQTTTPEEPRPTETVLLMERLNEALVTAAQIRSWTEKDQVLSRVRKYILQGWPEAVEGKDFAPYFQRKEELSLEDGSVLWGTRVVVPQQLRGQVMEEIHEGHPGCNRMKSFARSFVWWPALNADLESKVRSCVVCQRNQKMPPSVSMQQWDWPEKPWTRIHIDHAGPVLGKNINAIDSGGRALKMDRSVHCTIHINS